MLASEGAARFARSQGFETISPEAMMSPRAKLEWEHWKSALSSSSMANVTHCDSPSQSSNHPHAVTTTVGLRDRQDTVGAVAWDSQGAISAGVSSGGLLLKHPGRIGEPYMDRAAGQVNAQTGQSKESHAASPAQVNISFVRRWARPLGTP